MKAGRDGRKQGEEKRDQRERRELPCDTKSLEEETKRVNWLVPAAGVSRCASEESSLWERITMKGARKAKSQGTASQNFGYQTGSSSGLSLQMAYLMA